MIGLVIRVSCVGLLLLVGVQVCAQVKTDGSLGARQTLSGPAFAIPATLGRQVGGNLFHSFSDFNVQAGESATFSGPGSVKNVLSRVTGGSISTINGTLRCDIAGANLYLMNPAGVVFGPGATLDVSGSFAVTSADYLRLGKSGRFNAGAGAAGEVLSSAAPTAFGFLAARTASGVAMVGSQLSVNTGKTLSIVSNGNIALVSTSLRAPAGRVNLVAAGSKGQVGLRADDLDSPVDSSLSSFGDVAATTGTTIDTSGDFGGAITVMARDFALGGSGLASATNGTTAGRSIDLRLSGNLTLTDGSIINISTLGMATGGNLDVRAEGAFAMSGGSQILGTTVGAANGGHILVSADSITMSDPATVILNGPLPPATGNGGDISLRAHDISITKQAEVAVGTLGAGNGGTLRVRSDNLVIRGDGTPRTTGLFASSFPGTAGASGSISIRTGSLRLERAGLITVETAGSGAGGAIDLSATSVAMRDTGTLLLADTVAAGGGAGGSIHLDVESLIIARGAAVLAGTFGDGRGGNITIQAKSLGLSSGGQILGGTVAAGAGGTIAVAADVLSLDGAQSVIRSGADATATGRSGDISIRATRLAITNGGGIGAGTVGAGDGGNLDVRADDLLIRGNGTLKQTGLFASTAVNTTGAGGSIVVNADSIRIDRAGIITVETAGSGAGGSIEINAKTLAVDGLGTLIQADTAATTGGGPGGNMRLDVTSLTLSNGAFLVGATFGDGRGGNIVINSDSVVIRDQGTSIFAPTTALTGGGDAGTLTVNARSLTIRDGANIIIGTLGSGAGGRANINAKSVRVRGLSSEAVDNSSTLIAVGSIGGSGPGGDLEMHADSVRLENSGGIAVGTTGAGRGGSATIDARQITLDRAAIVAGSEALDSSDAPATGNAGDVLVHASKALSLRNGSNIGAKAEDASGGTITLQAPRITLRDSMISGEAGQTGGSIIITAHDLLYLFRSQINATGDQSLGNINIDPQFTVLDQSNILTTTQSGGGGNINLRTNRLFESRDALTFITAAQGATVNLTVYTPDTNITGSLVPVNASLIDASASFAEECSRRLRVDLSSFLITGRGGIPVQPGGLDPAFDLGVRPTTTTTTAPSR